MFSDNIFHSFFNDPFFEPILGLNSVQRRANSTGRHPLSSERCSIPKPRDIFAEFSRAADELFNAATRTFSDSAFMFPRHVPGYLRELSRLPINHGQATRVTLNGDAVERTNDGENRPFRHTNSDPVQMVRTRLQWYDSNTRRALLPPPAPSRPEPSGRLTAAELARLPLSIYRIKPGNKQENGQGNENETNVKTPTSSDASPVPVLNGNCSDVDCSPGSAYLRPVSRVPSLVPIQPLQSSPTRGQPECEVCLTEYRNKDQLRHLPCGHAFHVKCIDVWFTQSSTCPKCRAGVRTGLKRLERNRQRTRQTSCSETAAPVRAIRQRASETLPANGRANNSLRGRNLNTTRCERNGGSPQSYSSATDDDPNVSPVNDQLPNQRNIPVSGLPRSCNCKPRYTDRLDVASGTPEAVNRGGTSKTTTIPLQARPSSSRLLSSVQLPSTPDLSAIVRRKAAEAAIRRAELAEQERNRKTEETNQS